MVNRAVIYKGSSPKSFGGTFPFLTASFRAARIGFTQGSPLKSAMCIYFVITECLTAHQDV